MTLKAKQQVSMCSSTTWFIDSKSWFIVLRIINELTPPFLDILLDFLGANSTPTRHVIVLSYGVATYVLDVLWGQPIKLIQVVSTSEFHEY